MMMMKKMQESRKMYRQDILVNAFCVFLLLHIQGYGFRGNMIICLLLMDFNKYLENYLHLYLQNHGVPMCFILKH